MPVYEYKGINQKGKNVTGLVDGENVSAIKAKLKKDGIYPTSIKETKEAGIAAKKGISFGAFTDKISLKDIANSTRQLATLVGAHIPVTEALSALVDQIENQKLKRILSEVKNSVNEGASLATALSVHPNIFSNLYVNMVKAGEASGTLHIVFGKLADNIENQVKLRNKLISVMAYPMIMLLIGFVIIIAVFTYVVPKITSIFSGIKATLPLPTRIMIGVSKGFTSYWYIAIIVIVGLVIAISRYFATEKGRVVYHRLLLKLPVFGKLVRLIAISRFCETLSTLLTSGVPLLTSLNIVKYIVSNVILQKIIEKTSEGISEGDSIAEPLRRSGEFPGLVTHMIAVGEKTGTLENMLKKVSESYDNQIETTVTTLTSILEPIIIAVMGVIVGFIVISVILPLLKMQELIR